MPESKALNWPTILFLTLSPLVALAGCVWWIASGNFHLLTLLLAVVMAISTGLGITAGYHRCFAHRSFEAYWPVRLLLLLFGGACFEGSVIEWCLDHRRHHRHIDQENDPYNIKKGFWHAHMLWLFTRPAKDFGQLQAPDLWRDPLVRFQHRLYLPLAIAVSFLLPMATSLIWGDPWGGLFIAGALRLVVNQHFTFAINSVCHCLGKQTYSEAHSARDNWFTALLTYGEGYHNFHHEFPGDYRNGIRFYHWDPTKWVIGCLAGLKLARNLNRVQTEVILLKKLALQEKKLVEKLASQPRPIADFASRVLEATRQQIHQAAERLRALRVQYSAMKKQDHELAREKFRKVKSQLRQALSEFKHTVALWESMARRLSKLMMVAGSGRTGWTLPAEGSA